MASRGEKRTEMKVLVVGSGLAGLTSAFLLRQEGCEVYLVEKSDKLGFHSASVDIPCSSAATGKKVKPGVGTHWTVDVPMRSFQGGYYTQLIALYKHLDLPLIPAHFNYSFGRIAADRVESLQTYFIYSGANGLSIPSFPRFAFQSILGLLHALVYFVYSATCFVILIGIAFYSWHGFFPSTLGYSSNLANLQRRLWFIPIGTFIQEVFIPIFSSVGTMTSDDVMQAPLPVLLEYVYSTFGTDHYSLGGGLSASHIARRLAQPIDDQGEGYLRLGTSITDLRYVEDGVEVIIGEEEILVDKVIIATQASSARTLLRMLLPTFRKGELRRVNGMLEGLEDVRYRETIIVTHRDASILPHPLDVRTIDFISPIPKVDKELDYVFTPPLSFTGSSTPSEVSEVNTPLDQSLLISSTPFFETTRNSIYTMATHVISPPEQLRMTESRVFQTTNPVVPIDQKAVLGIARLERALPLRDIATLDKLHPSYTSSSRIHLAGSYAYTGIPLLEGCVGSARLAVSRVLGQKFDDVGGVDWQAGQGGWMSRIWRWRSKDGRRI